MTGTRHGLEILPKCGKRVITKIQKVMGANSYVCSSYGRKPGKGDRVIRVRPE